MVESRDERLNFFSQTRRSAVEVPQRELEPGIYKTRFVGSPLDPGRKKVQSGQNLIGIKSGSVSKTRSKLLNCGFLTVALLLVAGCGDSLITVHHIKVHSEDGQGPSPADSDLGPAGAGTTPDLVIPNNISSALDLEGEQVCVQLRTEVTLPERSAPQSYAIDAGRLSDVSRIYLNDVLISSRGSLSPYYFPGAFRPQTVVIPQDVVRPGRNSLRIHLCSYGNRYPIQAMDPIRLGSAEEIWQRRTLREIVAFSFLAFYLMAAFQHLWLGLRRKKERYHLSFSGFLLVVSAYWFVAETMTRDLLFGEHVLTHRKTEYVLLFFIVPFFLRFLSRFSHGKGERVSNVALAVAATLTAVSIPSSIHVVRICGWIWQIGFLALSPYLAYLAYRQLVRPFPYAKLMTAAVLLLLASAIHDILVSLSILHSMRISSYSLAFLVLGLIVLLGDQLVQATNRSEKLLSHATRLNLEMLKKNIHPHFLANSLNSAMELVHEDPSRAEKLLLALVEELRSTIHLSEQKLCPMETEVQLCRNHIEVMSLRMEKDIRLEVVGNLETQIPPLVLLTIVENGITHGFKNRQEGWFRINVRKYNQEVFIAVENNGDAPKSPGGEESWSTGNGLTESGRGTGTRYVRSRLEELCPGEWSLFQEMRDEKYVVLLSYLIDSEATDKSLFQKRKRRG